MVLLFFNPPLPLLGKKGDGVVPLFGKEGEPNSVAPPALQPAAIWFMIRLTSSVRGSSAVNMVMSASWAEILPIMGRLAVSLSPAHPNTEMRRGRIFVELFLVLR